MKSGILVLLVAAALLTQRWYAWQPGHDLGGDDADSYAQIARAAPALPPPAAQLPFHHAQRLAGPWLLGVAAKATGLPVQDLFRAASGACLLLAIALLGAALARVGATNWEFAIGLGLFALHFTLKFYLVAPGMLPDALFLGGLGLVLYGLAATNAAMLLGGVLLAAAGRQTALLLLPGIALWVAWGGSWARQSLRRRAAAIALAAAAAIAVYIVTGHLAAGFALPSENLEHLAGLALWLRSPDFSAGALATFLGYAIVPLALALAAIAGALPALTGRPPLPELLACLLMTAAIASQPFLGGPDITGPNAVRLTALGLAPLSVALLFLLRIAAHPAAHWQRRGPLILAVLAAASLHHLYTRIGPENALQFGLLQLALALALGYLVFSRSRISSSSTS